MGQKSRWPRSASFCSGCRGTCDGSVYLSWLDKSLFERTNRQLVPHVLHMQSYRSTLLSMPWSHCKVQKFIACLQKVKTIYDCKPEVLIWRAQVFSILLYLDIRPGNFTPALHVSPRQPTWSVPSWCNFIYSSPSEGVDSCKPLTLILDLLMVRSEVAVSNLWNYRRCAEGFEYITRMLRYACGTNVSMLSCSQLNKAVVGTWKQRGSRSNRQIEL